MSAPFRIERWSNHPQPSWETRAQFDDEQDARADLTRQVGNERGLVALMRRTIRLVDGDGQVLDQWIPSEDRR